ncbi:hypothetical protein OG241_00870 [Streptomyces sp. NBC_01390]|uniref:hypothetical protein n=1 Tax=Streptomyces sp. NBC_01390 TaxID=2903850 RepID=UPI003255014F
MRHLKTTTAALACAFALIPAAVATAGTGPAPAPTARTTTTSTTAAASTAPSADGNPASPRARAAGVCADAYQIGSTGYITRAGKTAASVKQFYSPSCAKNYGYVWVWQSFRDAVGDYDVTAAVYSYSQDEVLGKHSWTNTDGQEFWSSGTSTVNECTAGSGTVRAAGDPAPVGGYSSKRC